jgi:hypothetical protein
VSQVLSAEQVEEIGRIFDEFDSDKSGELDVSEMRALLQTVGFVLTEVETEHMVASIDVNGDHKVRCPWATRHANVGNRSRNMSFSRGMRSKNRKPTNTKIRRYVTQYSLVAILITS